MHGNMTQEEKKLNKDDITAFKNFDNNQYSLIPGVSKNKMIMVRDHKNQSPKSKNQIDENYNKHQSFNTFEPKYQTEQDRIRVLGHSRDPKDASVASANLVQQRLVT